MTPKDLRKFWRDDIEPRMTYPNAEVIYLGRDPENRKRYGVKALGYPDARPHVLDRRGNIYEVMP